MKNKPASSTGKLTGSTELKVGSTRTVGNDSRIRAKRQSGDNYVRNKVPEQGIQSVREPKETNLRVVDGLSGSSRQLRKVVPQKQTTVKRIQRSDGTRIHRYAAVRPSRVVYQDRPHLAGHTYHYDHAYRDYRGRICRKSVWPRYHYGVRYNRGSCFTYRYVYPYYHRKYLFISLGGYWPIGYRYVRYYWYGCHPYDWYGYYPIAREVRSDTYNYYTYNYYSDEGVPTYESSQIANADVFENLSQQAVGPDQATLADVYFEEAVKVFEAGKYNTAVEKFAKAIELAPDDMILPFAYSQALMANEQYSEAARVLRAALSKVRPEKEGVFYPRGLYPDEDTLLEQIDRLAEKAELYGFDADLQLLLGYQLLGIGDVDRAVEPLMKAGKDLVNTDAAAVLLELLEKIKTADSTPENSESGSSKVFETIRIPPESKAIVKGHSIRLKKTMFVSGLCALVTSAGIFRYTRC
jgi:hypothetical protein